jgi:TetR/AcrR family transcriptional repressor of nem operon
MRVSKEKAAENRIAILQAASRLFRKRGIDDVGVAEIAKEAGLTHGALYAHFPSKDALVAEAFSYGFEGNMAAIQAWAADRRLSFNDYLDGLVSIRMRDRLEAGCPMAAAASEMARQGRAASASYASAFEETVAMIEGSLEDSIPASQRRRLAVAAVVAEVGAIAVSRSIEKSDKKLADEVLQAVRETVSAAHKEAQGAASV